MEKVLTVEVNLNLKADESLQKIVAYVFGQKLTADCERQSDPEPQPATEQPNPEPQPAVEQPAETEAKPKRTRSKKADPTPAADPQPTETEQPTADPEPDPEPQPATEQPNPDPQPTETEQPTADPEPEPEPQPAEKVSLEEVKQVFFQKLAGHRDEIRSKINELGAPSLSTIEAAKLPEMLNFLKSLD